MIPLPQVTNSITTSGIIIMVFVLLMVLFNYSFLKAYKSSERRNAKLQETLIDLLRAKNEQIKQDTNELAKVHPKYDRRKDNL